MSFSQQRTPEWHTQRSGKVTASVCGTIVGVNSLVISIIAIDAIIILHTILHFKISLQINFTCPGVTFISLPETLTQHTADGNQNICQIIR